MKIIVCGSRSWTDHAAIEAAVPWDDVTEVHHGDANGADHMAGCVARSKGKLVFPHPANWFLFGNAAGMIRNAQMLEREIPDRVYAFWDGESHGTAHMIRIGREKLGDENVIVVHSNKPVEDEVIA